METSRAIQLQVAKDFPVPVARLYEAWISPEALKQWWRPMGNVLQRATTKPEQDGAVEYVFASEQGEHSFTIKGQYKEVAEAARLVYTWNWEIPTATVGESEFLLTVVFSGHESGSRLEVTQENFISEESVQPHRDGWEKGLEDLHRYLSAHQQ